jgi:hypothetical protein
MSIRQAFRAKLMSAALIVTGVLVLAGWAFNILFLKAYSLTLQPWLPIPP